ncbi:sugar ABC transporter permease (plasmid) [Deinococcus sp. D7000]|uniref:Multiple sugar transport system permease protein n=1 Tax=Deinococcus radiopugnans ATCC 19172 TaxID=585398 RepID=A0A5C4YBB4_9DEIO|nr:sugar ABC transporter permease [Deinococcus radiopugnans]MBB6015206.1 multiple sugar transport system permease protein [Deinococcus radiopugnans ATCC 19172]QLG13083.1 sugar ABC transporter permease [Deinococcus sp. D7000]TNM73088.1 sugar ABC transporter permease [Deinococcus radiopugnans ATCC 19172]
MIKARITPASRPGGQWRRAQTITAYLFILPNFIFFFTFFLIPVAGAVALAFMEYLPGSQRFVGLDNFRAVFADPLFGVALRNTAVYTFFVVLFWLGKALLIAYLLDPLSKFTQTFFKSAFYLPSVTSGVIISLVWLWIFNPTFGLLNALLNLLGLDSVAWLGNTSTALPALIFMHVVMGGGSSIVLLSAALARIPRELYETALLDGASRLGVFRNVIVPLIQPTLLYLVVTGTINTFQVFESVYIMTQGGPQFSTTTVVYLIYETAFVQFQLGTASAQAMILFLFTFVLAAVQFKWLGRSVEY